MRISDWSSDVCSSDLQVLAATAPLKHWSSPDKQWSRRSGDMIANKYGNPMKLAGWIFLPSLAFMLAGCGDKDPKNTEDLSNGRSEEHTSELQSLMRISYAVFCLKKKTTNIPK